MNREAEKHGQEQPGEYREATILDKYASWAIKQYSRIWGEMAPESLAEARLKSCRSCDKAGKVTIPLPAVIDRRANLAEMDGCTICRCPFATKPKVLRYFSITAMRVIRAECPHPDGSKWPDPVNFEPKK